MESLKTYTYCRKAQYHETDQMGIIHHSNYVKWMEEARIGYMNQMGFSYKKVEELGVISPVVEISVAYKNRFFLTMKYRFVSVLKNIMEFPLNLIMNSLIQPEMKFVQPPIPDIVSLKMKN